MCVCVCVCVVVVVNVVIFFYSVVQITPLFSDVALHLFLRTNLSIKEMESILSGQETTSIVKISNLEEMLEQKESQPQEKKCSRSSAGDSGYSESSASDETIKVVAEGMLVFLTCHLV